MTDLTKLKALFPDSYSRPLNGIPRGGIRLFGSNWAFGVIGKTAPLADNGSSRFAATHFYAENLEDHNDTERHLHQNVFPLNLYEANAYHEKYPLLGKKEVGSGTTKLLIQQIELPGGDRRLYQLLQGRLEVPAYVTDGRRQMVANIRRNSAWPSRRPRRSPSICIPTVSAFRRP